MFRAAVGKPDLNVEIISALAWDAEGRIAAKFREGRVFLVGDAAHVMPPAGGFGLNTGVQDSHNLAWKLAAVIDGQAGESLLDSYAAEQMPVARAVVGWRSVDETGIKTADLTAVVDRLLARK